MPQKDKSIQISIIDDHPVVISGLISLLEPYPYIHIKSTYSNASALLQDLQNGQPDVLILDIYLPDVSGKELAPIICAAYPDIKMLVLTSVDVPAMATSMFRLGCSGYLLKGAEPEILVEAIETLYQGDKYVDNVLKEQLLQNVFLFKNKKQANPNKAIVPVFTQREKEVLNLIAEEYTTREIADSLFISYHTVESHRNNLIQKLSVKNTAGLVKAAIQLGLLND